MERSLSNHTLKARSPLKGGDDTIQLVIPARAHPIISAKAGISFFVFLMFLLFSTWLMFHTFGYDNTEKNILIARTVWSDFGSHIPLIRSFSMGDNFDRLLRFQSPEYPLFSGEPIRYHFLFYMVVGLLEKIGLRLDWALNLPSILGFTLLLTGIWSLAIALFKDKKVAFLSILFFLFNGSLSFLKFFKDHPLTLDTPLDILRANSFPAFGPWDGGLITAFWNLNIFTNQRHLAWGFAIGIWFLVWVVRKGKVSIIKNSKHQVPNTKQAPNQNVLNSKRLEFRIWNLEFVWNLMLGIWNLRAAFLWGLIIGILPYFHQPMLIVMAILMGTCFLFFPRLRIPLALSAIIGLLFITPQLYAIAQFSPTSVSPPTTQGFSFFLFPFSFFRSIWFPGYLIFDRLNITNFLSFWFQNLGLHSLLIPLGFFLIPRPARRILFPLFILFAIGNLFKFSMEVAANHKFFNFALILGNMISAYMLVTVFINNKIVIPGLPARRNGGTRNPSSFFSLFHWHIISFIGRICIFVGFVGLFIFSGVIDFFVIINDSKGPLPDVGNNQAATWIAANTPKDSIFLNSSFLYHPASIAGRHIFMGWPYFAWSAGYDTYKRNDEMKLMYESRDPAVFCPILKQYNISYLTVEDTKGDPNLPSIDLIYFRDHFDPIFAQADGTLRIYQTTTLCPTIRQVL